MEPGAGLMDWKGTRVYLRIKDRASSGPAFDDCIAQVAQVVGEAAKSILHALAIFEVTEVRPIVDMAQGWERSI